MRLGSVNQNLLHEYLGSFDHLVGDKRTGLVLRETVQGIIGAESLICARIAAYCPELATRNNNGEQRIRRMVSGETTKRSDLDADSLIKCLQGRGVEQLREDDDIWVVVDPSELRKPNAHEMPSLMRVRGLGGKGLVNGYRTINALGIGRSGRRGVLYHRLFSSTEDEFESESNEIAAVFDSVGSALRDKVGRITYLIDTQFDDVAVWSRVWEQGNHLVCRLKHDDRRVQRVITTVENGSRAELVEDARIIDLAGETRELVRLRTEIVVRKNGQKRRKLQPTTAIISACPFRVRHQVDIRTRKDGEVRDKDVWLVKVQLDNTAQEPWLLITDWPVTDEESALRAFRMYRERWAIEDCFKYTKDVLGWEDVQVMTLDAIRTLVALSWVAAGFLYELGVSLDWPEIQLIARLGGWTPRSDRPPGKTIITRGLQRLIDHLSLHAILADEVRRRGGLPPRIAAMLIYPSLTA
jgi:hypothetical protein